MKTIILLFSLLLSSSTIATDAPLAKVDSPRIRAIAEASIAAKYPGVSPSKLVFDSIQYSLSATNGEAILVTYQLPSSTETKDESTEATQKVKTKTETISVRMSILGKVENVSKGSSIKMFTKPN
jgi:hypothetical protein